MYCLECFEDKKSKGVGLCGECYRNLKDKLAEAEKVKDEWQITLSTLEVKLREAEKRIEELKIERDGALEGITAIAEAPCESCKQYKAVVDAVREVPKVKVIRGRMCLAIEKMKTIVEQALAEYDMTHTNEGENRCSLRDEFIGNLTKAMQKAKSAHTNEGKEE